MRFAIILQNFVYALHIYLIASENILIYMKQDLATATEDS